MTEPGAERLHILRTTRLASFTASTGTLIFLACQIILPDFNTRLFATTSAAPADYPFLAFMTAWLSAASISSIAAANRTTLQVLAGWTILALAVVLIVAIFRPVFGQAYFVSPIALWLLMYGHIIAKAKQSPAALPSSKSVVDDDFYCIHCEYNLRALPSAGRCPECGQPIQDSLQAGVHHVAIDRHAQYGVLLVALLCFFWVALDVTVEVPSLWRALWAFTPASVLWIQMAIMPALVVGCWVITRKGHPRRYDPPSRRLARLFILLSVFWLLTSLMDFVAIQHRWNTPAWYSVLPQLAGNRLAVIGEVAGTFAVWFMLLYLRDALATRHGRWLQAVTLLTLALTPLFPLFQAMLDGMIFNRLTWQSYDIAYLAMTLLIPNVIVLWLGAFLLICFRRLRKL